MKRIKTIDSRIHELEKANKVISRFITCCSHEMRAPLRSIDGLVQLLNQRSRYTQEDATIFVNLIGKTTSKMEIMLNALEQLMENTMRQVIPKAMDLNEMIHSILALRKDEIAEAGLQIELINCSAEPIFLDRSRLHLVITDLLKNAIQFRDESKHVQTIKISLNGNSDHWIIRISDNGIGIPDEEHENIFHLFHRATEKSSGSGIGLYLVREAVEKMGGTIGVKSIYGQETIFEIMLPKRFPSSGVRSEAASAVLGNQKMHCTN